MLNQRGQSALEYLMTYGWALIVIAIVIAVLIFVTSGATGGATCQSSSQALVVKESSISAASGVGLTLMNATGGQIVGVTASASASPTTTTFGDTPGLVQVGGVDANVVPKNSNFTVTGLTAAAGTLNNVPVRIDYNTAGGLPATAIITCNGTIS